MWCVLLQCIWGSYWKEGKWGYRCCHSFVKYSYCTGEAGKEIAVSILLFIHVERAKSNSCSLLKVQTLLLLGGGWFFRDLWDFFFVLLLSNVLSNNIPLFLSVVQNTEASLMEEQPGEEEHVTKPKTLVEVGCFPFSGRQIFLLNILRDEKICLTTKLCRVIISLKIIRLHSQSINISIEN